MYLYVHRLYRFAFGTAELRNCIKPGTKSERKKTKRKKERKKKRGIATVDRVSRRNKESGFCFETRNGTNTDRWKKK